MLLIPRFLLIYQNLLNFAYSATLKTKFCKFDESHPAFIYVESHLASKAWYGGVGAKR